MPAAVPTITYASLPERPGSRSMSSGGARHRTAAAAMEARAWRGPDLRGYPRGGPGAGRRPRRRGACEPLEPMAGYGLARLPEPSAGDVFFDLEGDPYVGEGGLEYLFGDVAFDDKAAAQYAARWAPSREEEKRAFEEFVDGAIARWQQYPCCFPEFLGLSSPF